MKDRDFLVIQYDMMTKLHLKPGPMRDLFAIIYNYSKDGIHTYRASMDALAEQIGVSERYAISLVNTLLASGYINREQKVVICTKGKNKESRHAKYEYTANYEQLLARVDAGEEIYPIPVKSLKMKKGEQSSSIFEGEKGEQSSSKRVNFVAKKGEQSSSKRVNFVAGINNKDNEGIDKDISLSESAPAREAEEREFFIIFFLRNAADPAAETRKFVGWYQSRNWTSSDGVEYKTTKQRCGLAYAWNLKGPGRLQKSEMTDRFYGFLKDLYVYAKALGGIEPWKIIDTHGGYYEMGQYRIGWRCLPEVRQWVQTNLDSIREIKNKYFGAQMNVTYV